MVCVCVCVCARALKLPPIAHDVRVLFIPVHSVCAQVCVRARVYVCVLAQAVTLLSLIIAGTVCVVLSFPFLFMQCLGCSHSDMWAQFIYYSPFVVIFQIGWAATQISHLSLVPELTTSQGEKTELYSIRWVGAGWGGWAAGTSHKSGREGWYTPIKCVKCWAEGWVVGSESGGDGTARSPTSRWGFTIRMGKLRSGRGRTGGWVGGGSWAGWTDRGLNVLGGNPDFTTSH